MDEIGRGVTGESAHATEAEARTTSDETSDRRESAGAARTIFE